MSNILRRSITARSCIVILLSLVLNASMSHAQRKWDYVYSPIDFDILGEAAPLGQAPTGSGFFWGNSFDYAVYSFTNILRDINANKKEEQQQALRAQQSMAKLNMIKGQYASYPEYPEAIVDGWHNVVVTDNMNFCSNAKVLVKDNRIIKFVVNECVPLNFLAMSPIRNGKTIITLRGANNDQLNIIEVYFLFDLDEPVLVDKPEQPGYVCFWTTSQSYDKVHLKLDGQWMEKMTVEFDDMPDCFSNGMVCRILKPGTYSYMAQRSGGADSQGTFEVRKNECLRIRIH
ncbi:MAG: hypothetical protein IPK70_13205 [Flavobacteriales bacterium]|jgi:hypothetical protein|nr:hypothetical protein [Flavobacteriales bacterium]